MLRAQLANDLVDAQNAPRRKDYRCPACHEFVRLHRGTQMMPYFAHLPRTTCVVANENETPEHLVGKRQLAQFFASWGPSELEHVLMRINQRADVWVSRPTQPVAIEFQCSPLDLTRVSERTAGYQQIGCYPFWILGHRYSQQHLNWALIERFAGWLPGWELCLLFWDVTHRCLQVEHHLYQTATGHYGGQTTRLTSLAALMAGPSRVGPYPQVRLSQVRQRWAQQLAWENSRLRPIQEFLYLRGHHLLAFPAAFATVTSTPPFLGQGILLWRILLGTTLFEKSGVLTLPQVTALAEQAFGLVGGHDRTVRVHLPRLVSQLRDQFLTDLVQTGCLCPVADGWQIMRRPRWQSATWK